MKFKKKLLVGVAAAMFGLSANAAMVVNDWTINATGLDPTPAAINGVQPVNGVVNNISFLGFQNVFHTVLAGAAAPGSTFTVDSVGLITSFQNLGGASVSPLGYNSVVTLPLGGGVVLNGWEMSFAFTINGTFSTASPSGLNFDHTSGTLNFYIDSLSDPVTTGGTSVQCATAVSAASCTDGVLVASFSVINDVGDPSYGGTYDPSLGNGGDRSLFSLAANPLGVFRDSTGAALAVGSTLAITNSDFQSDVEGSGPFQYNPSTFSPTTCGQTTTNFCGTESGQFRIAEVPEPGSLALLSIGLIGLSSLRRSKKA